MVGSLNFQPYQDKNHPGLGGSIYFHPVQDNLYPDMVGSLNFQPFQGFISVNYHRQAGSLNFRPVRGFIFVKHHRLGGSIYFQPVCDILENKTLDRSEVCLISKYISYNTLEYFKVKMSANNIIIIVLLRTLNFTDRYSWDIVSFA